MSKKKPAACSVEKTLAEIAQAVHAVREEGESTDRLVGVVSRGLAALTARVEEIEQKLAAAREAIASLQQPPRTWGQFFRDYL